MGESRGLASCAAQPHAMLRNVVTVEDVLASPMVADPCIGSIVASSATAAGLWSWCGLKSREVSSGRGSR